MGRMANALSMALVVEIALTIFPGATATGTSLFSFFMNPAIWSLSTFMSSTILNPATLIAGGGAVLVGAIYGRTDWVFRAGLVAIWVTFGAILVDLYTWSVNNLGIYMAPTSIATQNMIASLVVLPFIMFFIMASIDFISRGD